MEFMICGKSTYVAVEFFKEEASYLLVTTIQQINKTVGYISLWQIYPLALTKFF